MPAEKTRAANTSTPVGYKRIATEEAFATEELLARWRRMLERKPADEPGFQSLWGFFLQSRVPYTEQVIAKLLDLDARRLRDMDESGIDMQILSLTAPGVQVFDAATANAIAISSNDQLAEVCARHPTRFAGLAAVAPQDPPAAAREMERAIRKLGLKGVIINSHTKGEYLDDPKFWPIFEAAEALDVPIYIHPRTPPAAMLAPFLQRNLDGAIMGFAVEVALHTVAIILSGAFDRFPRLRIVIGHLGEGLPFWLFRLDHMQDIVLGNKPEPRRLRQKISDYFRTNIYVTSSGMAWEPAIMMTHAVLGPERVMYAMDYPYQHVPAEVAVTDALPISDLDKRRFYQLNAEQVFALNA